MNTRVSTYWETRGHASYRSGDLALKDYATAITLNPKSANALFGRRMVSRKAGEQVGCDPDIAVVMAKLGVAP